MRDRHKSDREGGRGKEKCVDENGRREGVGGRRGGGVARLKTRGCEERMEKRTQGGQRGN